MKEFIEKLIEELGEAASVYPSGYGCMSYEVKAVPISEAKKIVNELAEEYKGGFCEWFKYDYRTIAPKHHDNIWAISEKLYWRSDGEDAHIKFCPYCGKEMKVVE